MSKYVTRGTTLIDESDEGLKVILRRMTEGDQIGFSYEDVLKEMNRRADIARTVATIRLTLVRTGHYLQRSTTGKDYNEVRMNAQPLSAA